MPQHQEFGVPECTTTLEAAGLCGAHRWGIILPNSSRVLMLTYQAIVAVRYPELVLHEPNHIYIGHFVPHESTVAQEGFRTVLWKAPKDRERPRSCLSSATVRRCTTCCSNIGFQSAWYGGLRVSTTYSAAGATARIAVIVQTGVGFLSGGRRMQQQMSAKTAMGEQL